MGCPVNSHVAQKWEDFLNVPLVLHFLGQTRSQLVSEFFIVAPSSQEEKQRLWYFSKREETKTKHIIVEYVDFGLWYCHLWIRYFPQIHLRSLLNLWLLMELLFWMSTSHTVPVSLCLQAQKSRRSLHTVWCTSTMRFSHSISHTGNTGNISRFLWHIKYFLMKYTLTINLDGIFDALVKVPLPPVVSDCSFTRVCVWRHASRISLCTWANSHYHFLVLVVMRVVLPFSFRIRTSMRNYSLKITVQN